MMPLHAHTRIVLATRPADFRRGIDGLVALCRNELHRTPRDGTYFVFINRNRTMIRVLAYDGNGFWLMTKRLSQGRFAGWPRQGSHPLHAVDAKSLRTLLSGVNALRQVA